LIVVRESAKDLDLLRGMALQAHASARDVPGVDALAAAGIEPLLRPEEHGAELWSEAGNRIALVPAAGTHCATWQVMALASAARTVGKSQWWSDVFEEILERLRPRRLWLPSASRLTRDLLAGNRLLRVIESTVDTVVLGASAIAVGPQNPHGMMSLSFAITFSATERDELVRRNLQGRVTGADRGRWLAGWPAVPLGYRLDGDGRLRPDPDAGPVLELASRLLADECRDLADIADVLDRAGVATPVGSGLRRWSWDPDAVAAELVAITGDARA
jgi:DNA invertase Pin-like site-specific DNA recombinase